jgi:putative transposase
MKKIRKNYSLEFKIQAVSLSEQRCNVSLVAQELGICKESLVNWRKLHKEGTKRSERRAILSSEIFSIYHWSRGRYASPRVTRELEAKGMRDSRPFVTKLMRERDLRSILKKKFKKTTNWLL